MGVQQILPIYGVINAVVQIEFMGEFKLGHRFYTRQDQVRLDLAARNQSVAMIPVFLAEDCKGANGIPNRIIPHGFKPFDHIINIVEYDRLTVLIVTPLIVHHGMSVPDQILPMQI